MNSTVGTAALAAYRQFICSLFPAVMGSKEMTLLDIAVLQELAARPDQHPYVRKAYHSALTFETEHNM